MARRNSRGKLGEGFRTLGVAVVGAFALFALAEGVLFLSGVIPLAVKEDPYVGFSGYAPLFTPAENRDWVTAENKRDYFPLQRFPSRKAGGTVRIFCLGGSTTAGRPYGDDTSFCAWLRELLPVADPSHPWEVINAGGISYASYRVARVMEELLAYEPDVFIVYTGHNEFLERRTYDPLRRAGERWGWLTRRLNRTRVYTVVARLARPDTNAGKGDTEPLPAEVFPILDRSVGPSAYERDDVFTNEVAAHFHANLLRMADMARAVGARIIFVTPASNVADCAPFKSEADPSLDQDARKALALALASAEGDPARHADCLAIDPRLPDAHYGYGKWLLQQDASSFAARNHLVAARDEDICPLRASSRLIALMRGAAADGDVPLVDFVALLDQDTDGIPGHDQFVDHVHPTIETNGQLALSLIEGLRQAGVLSARAVVQEAAFEQTRRQILARVDDGDRAKAYRTLARVYAWAGKQDESITFAEKAFAAAPEDVGNRDQLALLTLSSSQRAALTGRGEEALRLAEKAVQLTFRRNPAMLDWLSQCHASLGDRQAARNAALETLALPNIGDYGSLATSLAEQLGDDDARDVGAIPTHSAAR